jgi:tRNA nucleotidyltransferase (CCA-adding enzyme)
MEIYLVGGAVRDKRLGLPVGERDWVVVGAMPQDLLSQGFKPVGKDFPVFLHPVTQEEYALARTERKTGPGYTGFATCYDPTITLEQDLRRRDLTINAMAETPAGELIDPYGGADDLDNGVLRHVSPAFAEDPVRILRVARFAARFAHRGFHVAHETNALMRRMVDSGEVDHLVPERVWAEFARALGEKTPRRFFDVLYGCGALTRLFPEVEPLYPPARPARHGQECGAFPALITAVALSPDPSIRCAALVCDIARATGASFGTRRLAAMCARLRAPTAYRELAMLALQHRERVPAAVTLAAAALLDLLSDLDAFRRGERFEDFLRVCQADARLPDDAHSYPPAGVLRAARQAAAAVEVDDLVAAGADGAEIARQLRERRIRATGDIGLTCISAGAMRRNTRTERHRRTGV